jgi:hypothetical protein
MKITNIREISSFLRNKDFLNTSLNYSWAIIVGPLLFFFIPFFLTKQIQGYYFAFSSISALSVLADLGFSYIILQFAAHEFAFLRFSEKQFSFEDPSKEIHFIKLASLFNFSIIWVSRIIIVSFPVIFLIGFFLFRSNDDNVNWIMPWIVFTSGSAITFFNSVLLAFFEGCDMVAKIQRIRFYNALVFSVVVLICLAFHFNLYSLALASVLSALTTSIIIVLTFKTVLIQLLKYSSNNIYNWKQEILKLFWKYAFSYSSVYFTVQIYIPLAFRFYGAEEAGRIGLSLAILNSILLLAEIWVVSVLPKINILVANKKWKELDRLFFRRFLAGEITLIFVGLLFFIAYFVSAAYFPIIDRLTSLPNLVILFISWGIMFLINSMAYYLRAHKEDPFYYILFLSSLYIVIVTYFITRYFTVEFVFAGLISACIFFLPWFLKIFIKHIKYWHKL